MLNGTTGGGAHKYANDWERELGIILTKQDEMDSLVAGMQFVMMDIVGECFTFKPNDWTPPTSTEQTQVSGGAFPKSHQRFCVDETSSPECAAKSDSTGVSILKLESSRPRTDQWWTSKKVKRNYVIPSNFYPYLLVSIGTGVSILRVDGPRKHERISGSTIGGGTYWGLCRLLTGCSSFKDILNLASKGDSSKVDMMVGDIYGKDSKALEKIGLSSDIVASSFGKLVANQNPLEDIKEEDLARALLLMVTNNIGQVAHLNAKLHQTRKIYFIGTFLQHNVISQQRLAYSIDYWSQGTMEAQFLEHEVNRFCRTVC
jgi:type II pantothenate kinase